MRITVMALLCSTAILCATKSMSGEIDKDIYVKRWDVGESFPWIRTGTLVYYRIERKASLPASLSFYESPKSQEQLRLTGSQNAAAEVIVAEGVQVTESFLREQMPQFLVFISAQAHSRVLDRQYLIAYNDAGAPDKSTAEFLSIACKEPAVLVRSNRWELSFFVANNDGTADEWKITGEMSPFTIRTSSIAVVKSVREIHPLTSP
jgi:hypothetical protein